MTANDHDRVAIRLTSSPVFLREEGFVPIDYRLIRDAAVNGTIPAHQRNSIWHFYRDDLTEIAAGLRLVRRPQSEQRKERVNPQMSKPLDVATRNDERSDAQSRVVFDA